MVTVLVVEDEKLIRKGLAAMISRSCLAIEKIFEAKNGEEALEILAEERIDLMLTDVRMPKINGIQLVERVKAMENPPIIVAVSGFDEFSYAVNMLRNGVKDYLLKPVEQDQLNQCMERLYQPLENKKNSASSHQNLLIMTLSHYMEYGGDLDEKRQSVLREIENVYLPDEYEVVCGKFDTPLSDQKTLILTGRENLNVCICAHWELEHEAGVVGKSTRHRGIHEIQDAYEEGVLAWKQSFFAGHSVRYQPVCGNSVLPDVSNLLNFLRLSRLQDLLDALQQGGQDAAEGRLLPDSMFCLCKEMVTVIAGEYQDLYDLQDSPRKFENIWEFSNWQNYLAGFSQWLELLCQRMDEKFSDYEGKQKMVEAVKFVRENFRSPINMSLVSNKVSMNYSLFSVLFKQYTGKNFVSFLQNLRLEEAKRLLLETDMRVNEICSRVGFSGEKHFLKVFKASVGVSPGDWRKLNRNKEMGREEESLP